jgi:rSAM/selenodomain-associated transferase 2
VRIAVVIPAVDEEDAIEAAIASARGSWERDASSREAAALDPVAEVAVDPSPLELIVVDGGSRDRTVERARAAGARVLAAPRGRALQLDAGWRATRADAVLFLHADTRLPARWEAAVHAALADPSVVGGAFALGFDSPTWALRAVEWGAWLRAAIFGLPYGDQALFARRAELEAIGGVPAVPILEDLDLVHALRRRGRLARLTLAVTTSARRYRRRGVARTWWRNAVALAGWRLGVDRERLAAWYAR